MFDATAILARVRELAGPLLASRNIEVVGSLMWDEREGKDSRLPGEFVSN